jgi:predicted ATPase
MRFRFADCVLDADRFELSKAGRVVPVQPKVLDLLLFLLRQGERTVTKEELLAAVWPGVATGESSLTRAVSFARAALGERERDAHVIQTVRGRGYRIGVPVAVEAASPPTSAARSDDFVGREAELARAEAALAAAAGGRGQLLLLAGEPGIGKTRLAQEVEALARARGTRARWGRCAPGESERAYWPWEQILRAELADWDADAAHAAIGEAAAVELAELVPELRLRLPELPRPGSDPGRARARLFDGVVALLGAGAAVAPRLLVLDDLHCADEPSLRLLGFLARDLAALRVLVLASYRDADAQASPPLVRTFAELARAHPERRTLVLGGLDAASAERWIRDRLGGDAPGPLVAACHARSEGNPLFLRELLHWLEGRGARELPAAAEVPEGIRHVLRQRTAGLPEPCRTVLAAAAVLGREFPAALLEALCALAPPALLAQLETAEAARLVEAVPGHPGRFRFTHGLIAETLYETLGAVQRARLHARAGEALEARYRPRPLVPTREPLPIRSAHLAELAHHFAAALPAGDAAKALDYCERAGVHALSLLAFEEAERHFERALRVLEATAPGDEAARARLAAARERTAAAAVAS